MDPGPVGPPWPSTVRSDEWGRPGFPFAFLGAGGRLPKARRGRVFIVQFFFFLPFLVLEGARYLRAVGGLGARFNVPSTSPRTTESRKVNLMPRAPPRGSILHCRRVCACKPQRAAAKHHRRVHRRTTHIAQLEGGACGVACDVARETRVAPALPRKLRASPILRSATSPARLQASANAPRDGDPERRQPRSLAAASPLAQCGCRGLFPMLKRRCLGAAAAAADSGRRVAGRVTRSGSEARS